MEPARHRICVSRAGAAKAYLFHCLAVRLGQSSPVCPKTLVVVLRLGNDARMAPANSRRLSDTPEKPHTRTPPTFSRRESASRAYLTRRGEGTKVGYVQQQRPCAPPPMRDVCDHLGHTQTYSIFHQHPERGGERVKEPMPLRTIEFR